MGVMTNLLNPEAEAEIARLSEEWDSPSTIDSLLRAAMRWAHKQEEIEDPSELLKAARAACWYDWSGNDEDAVKAIERWLRSG